MFYNGFLFFMACMSLISRIVVSYLVLTFTEAEVFIGEIDSDIQLCKFLLTECF